MQIQEKQKQLQKYFERPPRKLMTADLKAAPGRGCILCWPVDVIY